MIEIDKAGIKVQLPDLEEVFDGVHWHNLNGTTYDDATEKKIDKIMNQIYSNFSDRVLISFKKSYQSLSSRALALRRELGYGDDVVKFFSDFGFYYDMGEIAFAIFNANGGKTAEEEEVIPPTGVACISMDKLKNGDDWVSQSGKSFEPKIQKKINNACEKLLSWYPTRMAYKLNKNHKHFAEETLLAIRRAVGYADNEELLEDFGFVYVKLGKALAKKNTVVDILPNLDKLNIKYKEIFSTDAVNNFLVTADDAAKIRNYLSEEHMSYEDFTKAIFKEDKITRYSLDTCRIHIQEDELRLIKDSVKTKKAEDVPVQTFMTKRQEKRAELEKERAKRERKEKARKKENSELLRQIEMTADYQEEKKNSLKNIYESNVNGTPILSDGYPFAYTGSLYWDEVIFKARSNDVKAINQLIDMYKQNDVTDKLDYWKYRKRKLEEVDYE